MLCRFVLVCASWLIPVCLPLCAQADALRFGFTGPLSGPNAFLGEQMSRGIRLGFERLNHSQKLDYPVALIALDDGYEPERTAHQVKELISQHQVVGLLGSVGTPTAVTSLPLLEKYHIPLIAPVTGAGILSSQQARPYVFNLRANYEEEAFYLTKTIVIDFHIKPKDVAILVQKDAFGEGALKSLIRALKYYGLKDPNDILQVRHLRNHSAAENAAANILASDHDPKAIFLISTYSTCATLINLLNQSGYSPLYASFSFVGLEPLAKRVRNTRTSILSAQITPPIQQSQLPIVQEFLADHARYGDQKPTTTLELEGYIAARLIEHVLTQYALSHQPTRRQLMAYLEDLGSFDLGLKTPLYFSPQDHQATHDIWLQMIEAGHPTPFRAGTVQTQRFVNISEGAPRG